MGFEVALALILVVGAGLLATSLARLYRTGLGFDPQGIVNLDLNMSRQALDGDALVHWYRAFGDAVSHQSKEWKKPSYTAVVRLEGSVTPFSMAARALAAKMAPDIPAPVIMTMGSDLDASISSERMMAMLAIFFAACALLVTGIGLYGTLAYVTARRTSEIGIRIALGPAGNR